jgi:HicB family
MSSYPLNLPDSLKQEAQLRAKRDGVSLNQWIATAVAEKVGSAKAVDFFSERAAGSDPTGKRLLGILRDVPDRAPDAGDELPT